MTGLARAVSLAGFSEVAASLGADPVSLLKLVRLTPAMIADPEIMIPAMAIVDLLELAADRTGCRTFGLHMARIRQISDLGYLSLLIAHQPNMRTMLRVLSEFRHRIRSPMILRVESAGDIMIVSEESVFDRPRPSRQGDELALGSLTVICRAVAIEGWKPEQVCIGYDQPRPEDLFVYREVFGCPIEFGSDRNCLVIKTCDFDRPNPRGDASLAYRAGELIEAIVNIRANTIEDRVEEQIMLSMPSGLFSLENCAQALGFNSRTLQRRLSEIGTNFNTILERARATQLQRHFANQRLRLTDVACLLGYSSLSAFTRWHIERFGTRPSDARRQLRGTPVRTLQTRTQS